MAMHETELTKLKRADLQRLAKLHGIKANKKNADIIKDLLCIKEEQGKVTIHTNAKDPPILICESKENDLIVPEVVSDDSQFKESTSKSPGTVKQSSSESVCITKIPKLVSGMMLKDKKTVNFKQIHERHFNKMESLDAYIEKKKQRANQLRFSLKAVASDAVQVLTSMKQSHNTPTIQKRKEALVTPTTKSTNVKAKVDSWHIERAVSLKRISQFGSPLKKLELPHQNSACKKFDLKESLKKSLPYKPHKGKLRGLNEKYISNENRAEQRRVDVKQRNRTRFDEKEKRRGCIKNSRNANKDKLLQQRRGLQT